MGTTQRKKKAKCEAVRANRRTRSRLYATSAVLRASRRLLDYTLSCAASRILWYLSMGQV